MNFERHDGDILVRPLVAGDAPALHAAVRGSIASLSYWFDWCSPDYSMADATARVARCAVTWKRGTEYGFGIFDRAEAELIGAVGLSEVDEVRRCANLGYWVGERHRSRGVATRAASMVVAIGFEDLGIRRLEIVALPHNHASQRVALKLGAAFEGRAAGRLVFHGEPASALVYSLEPGSSA